MTVASVPGCVGVSERENTKSGLIKVKHHRHHSNVRMKKGKVMVGLSVRMVVQKS